MQSQLYPFTPQTNFLNSRDFDEIVKLLFFFFSSVREGKYKQNPNQKQQLAIRKNPAPPFMDSC